MNLYDASLVPFLLYYEYYESCTCTMNLYDASLVPFLFPPRGDMYADRYTHALDGPLGHLLRWGECGE